MHASRQSRFQRRFIAQGGGLLCSILTVRAVRSVYQKRDEEMEIHPRLNIQMQFVLCLIEYVLMPNNCKQGIQSHTTHAMLHANARI